MLTQQYKLNSLTRLTLGNMSWKGFAKKSEWEACHKKPPANDNKIVNSTASPMKELAVSSLAAATKLSCVKIKGTPYTML